MGNKHSKKNKDGGDGDGDGDSQQQDQQQQPQDQNQQGDDNNAGGGDDDSNNGNNNEDQVSELPKLDIPEKFKRRNRRVSVSAECDSMEDEKFELNVVPKSDEVVARIKEATAKSFLFSGLEEEQKKAIFDSMTVVEVKEGDELIKQGDDGDFFYVIDHGTFDVFKKIGDDEPKKVFNYDNSGSFGELALMYNCPRAATVKATSDAVVFALERAVFRHIIVTATSRQRRLYESFLAKVPLFANLTNGERSLIADCLKPEHHKDGDFIIKLGDNGDKFYLIEKGECVATMPPEDGKDAIEVGRMKEGQYFGERALIKNEPRAANVIAVGNVKVAAMDRAAFERLLGDVKDVMHRQIDQYQSAKQLIASQEKDGNNNDGDGNGDGNGDDNDNGNGDDNNNNNNDGDGDDGKDDQAE